jgi:hypothetical protein
MKRKGDEGTGVITGTVRLSFPHLDEPWKGDNASGDPKYSCAALVPKKDKACIKLMEEAIEAAKTCKRAEKIWGSKIPKNLHAPLRDGDEERDTEEHPEYEDMMFFNSSSKNKPKLWKKVGGQVVAASVDEFKAGDWVVLDLNFYPYSTSGNNGIAVGLNGVFKVRDGEALGGAGGSNASDFEDQDDTQEDDYDDLEG